MKRKTHNTCIVLAVAALALAGQSAHAAAVITSAGVDITTNDSWRTNSVIKPLDADGNNIYGTDGYFTSSWLANSLPAYATVGLAASMLTFAGNASYTRLDNAAGTATIQSGVHYRQPGAVEMDFYTITLTAATSFRLGIITDNADFAAISPSDLRVRQTVGGTANSGLISAAADRDKDGDYYFFDITGGQNGDVFVVSGVNDTTNASNGLAGITFDTIPEPSSALLGGLGLLVLFRRRR